ncbi:MAG: GFA family protein [Chromatiales bacterium]|jgi:hypothetical protein|nr:GFA family protein [Chromatiales bacterium]
MSSTDRHEGACFCGIVRLEVTGQPAAMGYCHCESCRAWSAGPVNAFTLWNPEAVRIVQGADSVASYQNSSRSVRRWCRECGGHLMTDHPEWGIVDVYAAILPTLAFTPGVHVNYAESVLPIRDGIAKLRDFPRELGGSGQAMAESL